MMSPRYRHVAITITVFALFASNLVVVSGVIQSNAISTSITGKYIMAFLACDTSVKDCTNPQNHVTYLAQSNDGASWSPIAGFKPYPGSVPDLIRRANTLYIYNPSMLTRYHLDTGVQDNPMQVSLKYSNGTAASGFVDPSPILDGNGNIVLFYLPALIGQDPASCPQGMSSCMKAIRSATEVAGSDGASFVVDPGDRVDIIINVCCASDPSVFQGPNAYYLYVSEGQSVIAFSSSTLEGSYSSIPGLQNGVLVPQGAGGVPAGYYDGSTGNFWTYVTSAPQGQTAVIKLAKTMNISSAIPSSSFSTVLSGCTFPSLGCSYDVESPGVHPNSAGNFSVTQTSTTTSSITSTTTTPIPQFPISPILAFSASLLAAAVLLRRRHGSRFA